MRVCAPALFGFAYKYPLCIATTIQSSCAVTSPQLWQLVYGGYGSASPMFAWCFDAVMYLCVILAPCHS